jgi:tyrosinase
LYSIEETGDKKMRGQPGYERTLCEAASNEAEFEQLINLFESPSIHQPGLSGPLLGEWELGEFESEQRTRCPASTTATVGGFPRYQNTVASLPRAEQEKIRTAARLILRSFQPGCGPILTVRLVGHADRDLVREQREPGFMVKISHERALAVRHALERLINRPSVSSRITWDVQGAGSSQLVIQNPANELQRRRNRRVVIALITSIVPPAPPGLAVITRKRSSRMTVEEQNRYISVIRTLLNTPGNPYGRLVGIHANPLHRMHGIMSQFWPQSIERFLPWHRRYLLELERMMRRIDPKAFIPYWDWTTDRQLPGWLVNFNPMVTAIDENGNQQDIPVSRNQSPLPANFVDVASILKATTYTQFTSALEAVPNRGPHNFVHGWLGDSGGPMGQIPRAPADPIFWLHHAQVDRIWSIWQASPQGRGKGPSLTGTDAIMDPWPESAAQLASTGALGYTYGP